jgi:hypothetical protein
VRDCDRLEIRLLGVIRKVAADPVGHQRHARGIEGMCDAGGNDVGGGRGARCILDDKNRFGPPPVAPDGPLRRAENGSRTPQPRVGRDLCGPAFFQTASKGLHF